MNDPGLRQLLEAARDWLRPEMLRSEPLRRFVHQFGLWLVSEAGEVQEAASAVSGERASGPDQPDAERRPLKEPETQDGTKDGRFTDGRASRSIIPAPEPVLRPSAGIVQLKLGDATAHVPVTGTTEEIGRARASAAIEEPEPALSESFFAEGARVDLGLVERRSRLKAQSCLLLIERRAAASDPAREPELIARVANVLSQAKAMHACFLWMLWRERIQPDDETFRRISACYEAQAAAAGLVQFHDRTEDVATPRDQEDALQLLAESNSALRVALSSTWLTYPDVDQDEVHSWLRRETAIRHVRVFRYMRWEDPADPAQAQEVTRQAGQVRARIEQAIQAQKSISSLVGQVRYHGGKLLGSSLVELHDCRKICEALDQLGELGLAPQDPRGAGVIRALAPVTDEMLPPDLVTSTSLGAWLDAARSRPAIDRLPAAPAAARGWSTRVLEVRQLIAGSTIVLIGGKRRPEAVDRIVEAFALSHVDWVRLSDHGSGEAMRAPIERSSTSLVLVLVKLAGHQHCEEAGQHARKSRKACVFLKAGYNPEQIADAVLSQVSGQLRTRAGPAIQEM